MNWLFRTEKIYLDLIVSQLRSELKKLSNVLGTIERTGNYHDDYVSQTLKTAITELRRIKEFIEAN